MTAIIIKIKQKYAFILKPPTENAKLLQLLFAFHIAEL